MAKAKHADVWIVLDNVPYRHHYFQNRNRILLDGIPKWVTVPVAHRHGQPIGDVRVAADSRWKRKYVGRLFDAYHEARGHEFVAAVCEIVNEVEPGAELVTINLELIDRFMSWLHIDTPLVLASCLGVAGRKTDLLVGLCQELGATEYLSGPSGREYLELEKFRTAGIEVRFFDFEHPRYVQSSSEFVASLSAIDALACAGRNAPELLG
jgi:hypothetical protein